MSNNMDMNMSVQNSDKAGDSSDVSSDKEPEPKDNGPFYISFCNWLGDMYDRFDKPFLTFFIV